jgi:hypothetical protein
MTATVIKMSIQRMVCTGCGAEANASCNCGVSYIPKAIRAGDALRANPQKSDRAIADDLGVSAMTVGRTRDASGVTDVTPDRIGGDGKTYHVPVCDDDDDPDDRPIEEEYQPKNYPVAYLLRADQAVRFASYSGPIDKEVVDYARAVACARHASNVGGLRSRLTAGRRAACAGTLRLDRRTRH